MSSVYHAFKPIRISMGYIMNIIINSVELLHEVSSNVIDHVGLFRLLVYKEFQNALNNQRKSFVLVDWKLDQSSKEQVLINAKTWFFTYLYQTFI